MGPFNIHGSESPAAAIYTLLARVKKRAVHIAPVLISSTYSQHTHPSLPKMGLAFATHPVVCNSISPSVGSHDEQPSVRFAAQALRGSPNDDNGKLFKGLNIDPIFSLEMGTLDRVALESALQAQCFKLRQHRAFSTYFGPSQSYWLPFQFEFGWQGFAWIWPSLYSSEWKIGMKTIRADDFLKTEVQNQVYTLKVLELPYVPLRTHVTIKWTTKSKAPRSIALEFKDRKVHLVGHRDVFRLLFGIKPEEKPSLQLPSAQTGRGQLRDDRLLQLRWIEFCDTDWDVDVFETHLLHPPVPRKYTADSQTMSL